MALTSKEDVLAFVQAVHDPDHLRVLKQLASQRLQDMATAKTGQGLHLTQPHVAAGKDAVKKQQEFMAAQAPARAGATAQQPGQAGKPGTPTVSPRAGMTGDVGRYG